jgi:hypothetical protein
METVSGIGAVKQVSPQVFCEGTRDELAVEHSDDGWVRGARALCELYAGVDAKRFETILVSLATGRTGSAIADGAHWLLPRWHMFRETGISTSGVPRSAYTERGSQHGRSAPSQKAST